MKDTPNFASARRAVILGFATLVALVGGFGLWSVTATISGAIVAPGRIEVEQNRQVVQHPDGGVVAEILVTEGARVSVGAPLIRLDGTAVISELAIVEGQFFELQARKARLSAERDGAPLMTFPPDLLAEAKDRADIADLMQGQERLFTARAQTLSQTAQQLEKQRAQTLAQIQGLTAQSASVDRQLALIDQELADARILLEKGLAQAPRVLALEREAAKLSGQGGELVAAKAQAESRVTESELQVLRLHSQRREDAATQLRDIDSALREVAERRLALQDRVARLDICAPASGTVLGLQITTPRAVIRAADPLAYIVPQDRPLVIAAQISPLNIDEVQVGQAVQLRFPTFSGRTTPDLTGVVSILSADALTDSVTNSAYYRADITLSPEEAGRLGHPLLPGMPVEAFFQTTPRTPMAYLIKPFADYFVRAFRES